MSSARYRMLHVTVVGDSCVTSSPGSYLSLKYEVRAQKAGKMSNYHLSIPCLWLLLTVTINCVAANRFYIVPSSDDPCPEDPTNGDTCFTIEQYISNSSLRSGLSNVILELQPGTHNLDTRLSISNVSSFTMMGTNATLRCVQPLTFSTTENVHLSGINFINCGGFDTHVNEVDSFVLEDSTFQSDRPFHIEQSTNVVIVNSIFTQCPRGVLTFLNTSVLIKNCTFSNNIQGTDSLTDEGGAILASRSSITIKQSIFKNNQANLRSGAIHFVNGMDETMTVIDSDFIDNTAGQQNYGGAIHLEYGSIIVSGSTFTNNIGRDGGALFVMGDTNSVAIIQTNFTNNTGNTVGAIHVTDGIDHSNNYVTIYQSTFIQNTGTLSGAVYALGHNNSVTLDQSSFINNTCTDVGGGALSVFGVDSSFAINQGTFIRNTGFYGAVFVLGENHSVTVSKSIFTDNIGLSSGGGAVASRADGDIMIIDSEFNHNSAAECGVLDIIGRSSFELTRSGRHVTLDTSTFLYNSATRSGGGGVVCINDATMSVMNSTFSHNSAAHGDAGVIQVINNGTVTVQHSVFDNNTARFDGGVISTNVFFRREMSRVVLSLNHSIFTNNRAGSSGGVLHTGRNGGSSEVTIDNCNFTSNQAADRGGVIAVTGSTLGIERTVFSDNRATFGDTIRACSSEVTLELSNILFTSSDPLQEECTLYESSNMTVTQTEPTSTTTDSILTSTELTSSTTTTTDVSLTSTEVTSSMTTDVMVTTTMPTSQNNGGISHVAMMIFSLSIPMFMLVLINVLY